MHTLFDVKKKIENTQTLFTTQALIRNWVMVDWPGKHCQTLNIDHTNL